MLLITGEHQRLRSEGPPPRREGGQGNSVGRGDQRRGLGLGLVTQLQNGRWDKSLGQRVPKGQCSGLWQPDVFMA